MPKNIFPQITRFNPAPFLNLLLMSFLWFGLVGIIYLNYQQLSANSSSRLYFTDTINKPLDANVHIALARLFWDNNLVELAMRELVISEEIAQQSPKEINNQVKGIDSISTDILNLWKSEPEKIRQSYEYWHGQALALGNYRDAHLIAGILASQLGIDDQSAYHLSQAAAIDPNHPILKNVSW